MNIKLRTEKHLKLLSVKGGCAGSFESTLVKMPHCWKPLVAAYFIVVFQQKSGHIFHLFLSEKFCCHAN